MRITDEYREANRRLHEINPKYGTSSAKWAQKVVDLVETTGSRSILDYGCGKGHLAATLPQLGIREYDPAVPGKDADPEPADLVVCTDVLEHIEPSCLDDVLKHIQSVTRKAAFLNIATRPAVKTLPDGRNAHLIIESESWWRERIEPLFNIIEWSPDRTWAVNAVVQPRNPETESLQRRQARRAKRQRQHQPRRLDTNELPTGWFNISGVQEGRFDLERQMAGLDIIRRSCRGAAVLDLGCAEGAVSLELAKGGAKLVHGLELEADRLAVAEQLFAEQCPKVERQFIQCDLSSFDKLFLDSTADSQPQKPYLRSRYDIVLCLAIAQKLPNPGRFLRLASTLSSEWLAVRLPYPVIDDRRSFNVPVDIKRMLKDEFELLQETEGYPRDLQRPYQAGDEAWLGIFRRRNGKITGLREKVLGWFR
jgi:2-polyprenyl-3-methyl-5-hydroxy-6-metoxy-1,4-benzoquinol methylase